jgi:MFS family permease
LIAIEYFDCTPGQKSMIAAGNSWGLGLSVFYATYSHALIGRRNIEAAIPMFLTAAFIFLAAVAALPGSYALYACLAGLCLGLRSPLMTVIYRENYRSVVRGQVFGLILIVMALCSVLFTTLGGKFLDSGIGHYPILVMVLGVAVFAGALATLQIPSQRLARKSPPNPFSYFKVLRGNASFVAVLVSWFLFGIANLAMMPQRFEYVSQPRYGFSLSPGMTAMVVGVVPELTRILTVLPMGRLFDRMNFINLRILINVFLLAFQVIFFSAHSVWMLVLGSVMLGIGNAGGSVAWSLWVTRYAAPSETAKYMAMHTFFTGVRGVVGPYAGYWIAAQGSIPTVSWIASGFIAVSCILLVVIEKRSDPDNTRMADGEITGE